MKIEFPVIQSNRKYFIGGISEKEFETAGELNMAERWYEGVRYIDAAGQEWNVMGAKILGYTSFWQYLQPRKYRTVKIEFQLELGKQYDLPTLLAEIEEFIFSHRLKGAPFLNKKKDVLEWINQFKSIRELAEYKMYLDW